MSRGTRWLIALAIVAFVLTPVIASASTKRTAASRDQVAQPSSQTTETIALTGMILVPVALFAGYAAAKRRQRRRSHEPRAAWRTTASLTAKLPAEAVAAAHYNRSTTWA